MELAHQKRIGEKSTLMQNGDFIPVEGETFIYCFRCGTKTMIPPGTLENLELIREVEAESDRMRRTAPNAEKEVAFTRAVLCPICNNVMVCGDRYAKTYRRNPLYNAHPPGLFPNLPVGAGPIICLEKYYSQDCCQLMVDEEIALRYGTAMTC